MNSEEYLAAHSLNPTFVHDELGWEWTKSVIKIPIFDKDGNLLYCRDRQFKEGASKFKAQAGSTPSLYCIDRIQDEETVVFCEGEPDCARLWQEGIPAVTLGGVQTINKDLVQPLSGKTVLICLDTDEAGTKQIEKTYNTFTEVGAKPYIILLPKKYKDVCEYMTDNHTKDDFLSIPPLTFTEWNLPNRSDDYALETDDQLLAEPMPEEEWIIKRILPAEDITFIVGAEGTGKSFHTLTIAHSAVTGEMWMGQFTVQKKVKVLFIDKENIRRTTQSRLRGLGYTNHGDNIYRIRYPEKFQLNGEKGGYSDFALTLSQDVKDKSIGLVIIDSFADIMVGKENATEDVQSFFTAIRELFPGIAILVLHHENKPSGGFVRTSSQRVRGSSNITAQIAVGFRVEAIIKDNNAFTMEQIKVRTAEKLKKFKYRMVVTPDPLNKENTVVSALKYDGDVIEEVEEGEKTEKLIIEYLSLHKIAPRKELFEYCSQEEGTTMGTFNNTIREVQKKELVKVIKNGKFSNYSLNRNEDVDEAVDKMDLDDEFV